MKISLGSRLRCVFLVLHQDIQIGMRLVSLNNGDFVYLQSFPNSVNQNKLALLIQWPFRREGKSSSESLKWSLTSKQRNSSSTSHFGTLEYYLSTDLREKNWRWHIGTPWQMLGFQDPPGSTCLCSNQVQKKVTTTGPSVNWWPCNYLKRKVFQILFEHSQA